MVDKTEETVEVMFAQRCNFRDAVGEIHVYTPGARKIPASHAANWFLQQHLVDPPKSPFEAAPGTPEYASTRAQAAQAQKEAAQLEVQQQAALQAQREFDERQEAIRQAGKHIHNNAAAALAQQAAKDRAATPPALAQAADTAEQDPAASEAPTEAKQEDNAETGADTGATKAAPAQPKPPKGRVRIQK